MPAKFCAQCATGLGPADKFCANCGAKVAFNCPTCGQVWDGTIASDVKESESVPKKADAAPPSEVTINESFVGSKPIYGPDFDKNKDCANCGNAGKKKSCNLCGSGSQS